jgi:hypothetical protein
MMALVEGREEEGRRLLEQAIERVEQVGSLALLDMPTCLLAESDLLAGRAEQARRRLTSYLQAPHPTPAEGDALGAQLLLAWAEGVLGQETQAEARLATVVATAEPLICVDALRVRSLLALAQRGWGVAVAALDEALERIRAMPNPYAEAKTLWVYGRLEAERGDPAAAREHFAQALAICDRLGEGLYRTYIKGDLTSLQAHRGPVVPK